MNNEINEIFATEETLAMLDNKIKSLNYDSKKFLERLKIRLKSSQSGTPERRLLAEMIVNHMLTRGETPEYKRVKRGYEVMKVFLKLRKQKENELDIVTARDNNLIYLIESYGIELKHGKALCPFHTEKNPSFSVDKLRNKFKCFGCGQTGDCIDFVMKMENISFLDAVRKLN